MFSYNTAGQVVIVGLCFCLLHPASAKPPSIGVPEPVVPHKEEKLNDLNKTHTVNSDLKEVYSRLTGVVNSLKSDSCKCVSLFEECGVEMLEETVLSVEGRACLKNQRYCCQKEATPMKLESNLGQMHSAYLNRSSDSATANTILRDEISNMADTNDTANTSGQDPAKVYIQPSTLAAILRLLTEGFKFLSNFF